LKKLQLERKRRVTLVLIENFLFDRYTMVPWGCLELLNIVQRVTSACSLLGSSTICFLFFYLRWWNSSTHHVILFYVSIADIIYSSAFFVGPWATNAHTSCTIQGWAIHLSGLSAQMWCAFLGLNLWLQMKFYWTDRKCRALMLWYHAVGWGIPLILATIPAAQDLIVPQHGISCLITFEAYWLRIWTGYIPIWFNFGCTVFIITMIIRLLRYLIASIPEDLNDASKTKRHLRFVTCNTLMFIVGGFFCFSFFLIAGVWEMRHRPDLPYEILFLGVLILPVQGFFNLLVYVAPSQLQNFCCQKGYVEEMKSTGTDTYTNLNKKLPAVELMVNKLHSDNTELDEDDEPSTIGRLSAFRRFQILNERMSFCEGHGRSAVDILRKRLSATEGSIKDKAARRIQIG